MLEHLKFMGEIVHSSYLRDVRLPVPARGLFLIVKVQQSLAGFCQDGDSNMVIAINLGAAFFLDDPK